MKKIQVSTVKQTADVEVIYVNANLISKAIKSSIAIKDVDKCIEERSLAEVEEAVLDDKGCPVVDKLTGEVKIRMVTRYGSAEIPSTQLKAIHEVVVPFLEELTKAFEED